MRFTRKTCVVGKEECDGVAHGLRWTKKSKWRLCQKSDSGYRSCCSIPSQSYCTQWNETNCPQKSHSSTWCHGANCHNRILQPGQTEPFSVTKRTFQKVELRQENKLDKVDSKAGGEDSTIERSFLDFWNNRCYMSFEQSRLCFKGWVLTWRLQQDCIILSLWLRNRVRGTFWKLDERWIQLSLQNQFQTTIFLLLLARWMLEMPWKKSSSKNESVEMVPKNASCLKTASTTLVPSKGV